MHDLLDPIQGLQKRDLRRVSIVSYGFQTQ